MRQADMGRVALITIAFVALLVACNTNTPAPPSAEHVDSTAQPLLAQGQACNLGNQCTSGFCVDTVCCDTACGDGARDNMVCSNVYTGDTPVVGGTCTTVPIGGASGDLEGLNPCTWRGSTVNGGNNCPAPGNGTPNKACYSCSAGNNTCPPGLPICSQVNGVFGCSVCTGNFGSGVAGACPTSGFPICETLTGACVECTATNPGACAAQGKTCDPVLDKCVACLTDSNGPPLAVGECPVTSPFCINPGVNSSCVPCKAGNEGVCTGLGLVCDTTQNVCVQCLTSANCGATSATPVCVNQQCVACAGDRNTGPAPQCPTATRPACDAATGICRQCSGTDSTACAGTPTPVCSDSVGSFTCVECNVPGECGAGKPFCVNHTCSNTCVSDAQCGGTTPKCGPGGTCVECLPPPAVGGDSACVGTPEPFCVGTGCVQCRSAADCGGTTPVCNNAGACVPCNGNNSTPGATAACPSATAPACKTSGACVECTNGPSGDQTLCTGVKNVCDSATDKCGECTAANTSACVGTKPVCNLATDVCVACNGDNGAAVSAACPTPDAPACITGACVQCRQAPPPNVTACTDPAKTVCNGLNSCVQCTSNTQCVGNVLGICDLGTNLCTAGCADDSNCLDTPATPKCKTAAAPPRCVQCLDSTQCGGATPSCDPATNTCVACLTDAACGGTTPICKAGACVACDGNLGSGTPAACKVAAVPACLLAGANAGTCVECTDGDVTRCGGAKPACNSASHTCVQCGSNAQCSGNTPICNAAGTCIACDGDLGAATPAACTSALKPACLTAGGKAGSCAECSTPNLTACTMAEPVCELVANECVECLTNAQCHGPNGVCNTQLHKCTLGCTTDANCTTAAPACKTPENFCVECTATNTKACFGTKTPVCDVPNNKCVGCVTGADCPAATPVCDAKTKTCIANCTDNSQCPVKAPICDPVSHNCVPCVDNTNCKAPDICNTMTHTCGNECSKSSECPGSTPVCDPQTRRCQECVGNGDCGPAAPICNTTTHKCGTDCTKSSECPGTAPICNPKTRQCVGCIDDTSCPATAPLCDGTTKQCVADVSSIEGGGCSCSTVPSGGTKTLPVLVGLGLAVTALARRRRKSNRAGV
jgi:MYXO-CTERM domain-containing protein